MNSLCLALETVVMQRLSAYGLTDEGILQLRRHGLSAKEDVSTAFARILQ